MAVYLGEDNVNLFGGIPEGEEGIPVAEKRGVTNHVMQIVPKVTNKAGLISGGTIEGAPVRIAPSDIVSGDLSISSNGNYNVTNYARALVSVPGLQAGTASITPSAATRSLSYGGLNGRPLRFFVISDTMSITKASSGSRYYISSIFAGSVSTGYVKSLRIASSGTAYSTRYSIGLLTVQTAEHTLTLRSDSSTVTTAPGLFQPVKYTLYYFYQDA